MKRALLTALAVAVAALPGAVPATAAPAAGPVWLSPSERAQVAVTRLVHRIEMFRDDRGHLPGMARGNRMGAKAAATVSRQAHRLTVASYRRSGPAYCVYGWSGGMRSDRMWFYESTTRTLYKARLSAAMPRAAGRAGVCADMRAATYRATLRAGAAADAAAVGRHVEGVWAETGTLPGDLPELRTLLEEQSWVLHPGYAAGGYQQDDPGRGFRVCVQHTTGAYAVWESAAGLVVDTGTSGGCRQTT